MAKRATTRSKQSDLDELQELFLAALKKQRIKKRVRKKKSLKKPQPKLEPEIYESEKPHRKRSGKKKSTTNRKRQGSPKSIHTSEPRPASRSIDLRSSTNAEKNLVKLKFRAVGMQKLILALNAYPFNEFDELLERIPNKIVVVLGIKKPYQRELYYLSFASPIDYSVSTKEAVKKFVLQTVADYNNTMADLIDENYDEPTQVYKIREIGIRFIYPIGIIYE